MKKLREITWQLVTSQCEKVKELLSLEKIREIILEQKVKNFVNSHCKCKNFSDFQILREIKSS